ncbi:MAG: low molecular weight phosphotyrosine protein phosphatase [Polyangiaceae bacterium]|nr:low molecular weight phosphotyrosine protein phosphatase [Polyangiaceae bacterium]
MTTSAICFVCLGNICRSPTAEGVFRAKLAQAGLEREIEVDSAGTAAYHIGKPADARSREHAKLRGYELESVARQFSKEDFHRFDLILAMDTENLKNMQAMLEPDADAPRAQLKLFREYDPQAAPGESVPDPYHGGKQGFEEVLDICERTAEGLLVELQKERK